MNTKRAIATGIWLYVSSFVIFGIFRFVGGIEATTYAVPLQWYIAFWIAYIPLTLCWAKWYFRKAEPTAKNGLLLGVVAILVAFVIDGIAVVATIAAGESIEVFQALYMDWKFVVSILWVIALCTYAGSEFDATYTAPKK